MKTKKGVSGVITVVILIALVMAIIGIVWVVVNNLVKEELEGAGSCFDIFGKVNLNSRYICYDSNLQEFQFSISVGDIDLDRALIGISGQGTSVSFELANQDSLVDNLVTYPDRDTTVKLPGKNSGLTYIFNMSAAGFSGAPDSIEIAPIVKGNQCSVSDSLQEIVNCNSLIS